MARGQLTQEARLSIQVTKLRKGIAWRDTRISALEARVQEQDMIIHDLNIRVEELCVMVFGRKKQKQGDDDPPHVPAERTLQSYRRPQPTEAEVTETKSHPITACATCSTPLTEKTTAVFFEEDIPIPAKRIVRKHVVERGYCARCKRWSTAFALPYHKVILGNNVQKYICYLSIMCRLSYAQTQTLLADAYQFSVSQGEIAKILNREALAHRPEYERLKEHIQQEACVGLDETGHPLAGVPAFAWVMTGMESTESVYLLGESRGKEHVATLLGAHAGAVVTDDYVVYKQLPLHQLCWAHLLRKFRDLARSSETSDVQHAYSQAQYALVAELFADITKHRTESKRQAYTKRLTALAVITVQDCAKLIRLKTTLARNIPQYLTGLTNPLIPLTNNQSERSLRHLVLKRKISFGSFCKRTAENLAILLSVLMSRRQRDPQGYFGAWVGV